MRILNAMTPRAVVLRMAMLALVAAVLPCCAAPPSPSGQPPTLTGPAPLPAMDATSTRVTSTPSPSDVIASRYSFPAEIDPTKRYMFYLHGKIIEDQGLPAISPQFGEYKYEEILRALEDNGFVVIGEQRARNSDADRYARRVVGQVSALLSHGVPPGSITVVGASKGAAIATMVSSVLGNPDVNYVLLGACDPGGIEAWEQQGVVLSGNVLSIYDASDVEYAGSCEDLFALSEGEGLGRHEELVLHVGTGHGILYVPLKEWIEPTVRWANHVG